jgi:eukaryotic-like serine/threonine-protein kinase
MHFRSGRERGIEVTDFVEQLRATLGAQYRIERELGGGGMSRVFLAEDLALARPVVIKVLHPELAAGVNADRFKREVQLLARLQHPHIVPILAAGEANGLPYYVMPFVRGQSLRARLEESGPLPPADTAALLADVAKALAAAHADGVVHRDIKPDNILISGGAAVVADFGIAKALTTARAREEGGTLTSLGTSLGTPAYMAPEQVAGDPNVDHRADIYSLGCVAYEALTGAPPFAGKSPQQMLAAQVMEAPLPVTSRRPGIPAPLAALVMQCLEKDPAKRPQSAADLATLLDASTGTDPHLAAIPGKQSRHRTPWLAGAALVVIALAAAAAYRWRRAESKPDGGIAVAVAPFDVLDPRLALWKEGMVDVLSRNIDGAGSIRAISPAAAIKQWDGRADRTSAVAFANRVGAQIVLYGELQSAGPDFVDAHVWIANARRDATPIEVQVRDSASRMDRVTDSLSVRVLSVIGRDYATGPARLSSLGSGSLPAIKAFLRGSQYFRHTQWDSAAAAFQEAVTLDSNFAIAYGMLGQALGWTEGGGSRTDAYIRAGRLIRPGLSPRDSLLLTAMMHYPLARGGYDRAKELRAAFAAAGAAAERYPNDAQVLYVYADMRYHSDPSLSEDSAAVLFERAVRADSDYAPAWTHAVELSFRNGWATGRRYANAYLARNPDDPQARAFEFAATVADPSLGARDRKALLDTLSFDTAKRSLGALLKLADSAETGIAVARVMIDHSPPQFRESLADNFSYLLSLRGHISEAWALAVGSRTYLVSEIAALGLVPEDSALRVVRPWIGRRDVGPFLPIPVMALAHDTAFLTSLARRMDSAATKNQSSQRALLEYIAASARAYAALAAGDTATATREFDALPDSVVRLPFDEFMRARLVERQDPRRALALFNGSATSDVLSVTSLLERARLAERFGDRVLAAASYARVADLWQNTDSPQLRSARDEARAAVRRLEPDGAGEPTTTGRR